MYRRLLLLLLATIGLAVLTACGSSDLGQLLTGTQVEEELPDGSLRPVSGARVHYEIISNNSQVALDYTDTTDASGVSLVYRSSPALGTTWPFQDSPTPVVVEPPGN